MGLSVVRGGIITHTRSWLISPYTGVDSFDPYAVRIHGIDGAAVAGAPSLEEFMHALAGILGDYPILAHSIGYDAGGLRLSFEIAGLPHPTNEFRCTEKLARAALGHGTVLLIDIFQALRPGSRAAYYA